MTKTRSTKRALLMSGLALLMCVSMLIGSTFAWFTDSVTSAGNKIKSGTLDVKLLMHNGTEYVDISDSDKPIFGEGSLAQDNAAETLWEPGKTQIVYLAVQNAGSLALKYNILVDVTDNGLAGALKYAIIDGVTKDEAATYGADSWSDILAVDGVQTGDIASGRMVAAENGGVAPEDCDYFVLAVHMDEQAGNEYQNKDVVIDIELLATQLTYEEDSFDDQYDADAPLETAKGMAAKLGNRYFPSIDAAVAAAKSGDTVELVSGYNTQDEQLTETIVIDKEINLIPNGMYLVSNAPATFTVEEGGKLTVEEGSYTIKNTATNGAAVVVDGGEFEMAGGSFDAHTAVRTTEGKSSTVTLSAGWSNRVTVGFDLNGNDTLNVTGGSLYTGKEAVKTAEGTHVDININGGTLSSNSTQYSAAMQLNGTATVDMTGGTLASTYSSGLNGSAAIEANVAPTTINISGDAKLQAKGWGVTLGSHWSSPAPINERFTLNVSDNASIDVTGTTGSGIRYCQDGCDVTVSGNAKINGSFYAVQMSVNRYVFTNSTLTIEDNATLTSNGGKYSGMILGGYAVAANGNVTITGGTLSGYVAGLAVTETTSVIVVDNSTSGDAITINSVDIADGTNYTVAGNPTIG